MDFLTRFVSVFSTLLEPMLKLRVDITDRRIDISDANVRILYDPQLSPTNLTMPYPEEHKRVRARYGSSPAPSEVAFKSTESREISSFPIMINIEDHCIKVRLVAGDHGFRHVVSLLEKSGIEFIKEHPYEIILEIVNNIINIVEKNLYMSELEGINRIKVYLPFQLADELAKNTSFKFDHPEKEGVLIAERGARQ